MLFFLELDRVGRFSLSQFFVFGRRARGLKTRKQVHIYLGLCGKYKEKYY